MIHLIKFWAMGCQVSVQLETDQRGASVLRELPRRFASVESALTRFDPHSELMRLNASAGTWVKVSELLLANILAARQAALLTDGLYNPLILTALIASGYCHSFEQIGRPEAGLSGAAPDWNHIEVNAKTNEVRIPAESVLDLGGIAKGWVAMHFADQLAEFGACLLNIGGDMVARGVPQGSLGWLVEVEDPLTGEAFATVTLLDQAICTSGVDYRRWMSANGEEQNHIIDPRTGKSAATDVLSATVIHPYATTAEAYAKAVILQGSEAGLSWLNQQWHASALVFRRDGAVLATSTFIHERNTSHETL